MKRFLITRFASVSLFKNNLAIYTKIVTICASSAHKRREIITGKIKKRNKDLSLSLNYPVAPWCIFGLTQKSARQSSNKEGDTYTVNTTELQAILIY